MFSNRMPRGGVAVVSREIIQRGYRKSGLLPEAAMHSGFGVVPPSERAAWTCISKESKMFVENAFKEAAGKPDYSQLSQDLLDNYGIERSVQQLKLWLKNYRRRLNNGRPSITADVSTTKPLFNRS